MMKSAFYIAGMLCMALAWSVPAQAQPDRAVADTDAVPVRILEIHSGKVFLDGEALPASSVPADLNLDDLDTIVRFSGPVTPAIEIDGIVYVLDEQKLIPLSESSRAGSQVYFFAQPEAAPVPQGRLADAAQRSVPPAEPMPEQEMREASEAAYLQQISERDRSLYNQIRGEQALELETLRLADRIRRTPDAAAKQPLLDQLRAKLDESFELKQQIREDEIVQAEAQITELRRLLDERAARKEQIIDRRLRELIGED